MAIAGRVAIVPKGDYDVSVVYKKLDLVRYNQNAYVAKKPNTGIEPTDEEYWMLMVENVSATDLSELKEKVESILNGTLTVENSNNLGNNPPDYFATAQSVTDIVEGTTPAGNAKKLNGLTAEEFVSNKNLLIDPNFELYFDGVKKWKFSQGDGTVESAETGATITSSTTNVQFRQSTENMYFSEDGYITGSLEFGDVTNLENVYLVIYIDNVWSGNISLSKANDGIIDIKRIVTKGMHSVGLGIYMNAIDVKVNLKWLKLELSSIATPFISPNKEVEKLKCGLMNSVIKTVTSSTTISETLQSLIDSGINKGTFQASGCTDLPSTDWGYGIEFKIFSGNDYEVKAIKRLREVYRRQYSSYQKAWLTEWSKEADGGNADTVNGYHASEFKGNNTNFNYITRNGYDLNDYKYEYHCFVVNGRNIPSGFTHGFLDVSFANGAGFTLTNQGDIVKQTLTQWNSGKQWTRMYNENTDTWTDWSTNYLPLDGSVPMSGPLRNTTDGVGVASYYGASDKAFMDSADSTGTMRRRLRLYSTGNNADCLDIYHVHNNTTTKILHTGNSNAIVQSATAPSDTTAVWIDTTNNKVKVYKDGAWTAMA